jgi:2-polyprenyl-3-methyl-5-hydroxy-6-metoxy-1,4-benzoquinol methylase
MTDRTRNRNDVQFGERHSSGVALDYASRFADGPLTYRARELRKAAVRPISSRCAVGISEDLQRRSPAKRGAEFETGERFSFGENWQRFLSVLDEARVDQAERSLLRMLKTDSLSGLSFLDAGSGSGLFSLAAMRLGARRVHSFDADPQSVACTLELKRRYFRDAKPWTVGQGSVLDRAYIDSLGTWDVVYSWGVLHHTGALWEAAGNVAQLVVPGGRLFISIYNDQGLKSQLWWRVKRSYNTLPRSLRIPFVAAVMLPRELLGLAAYTAVGNPRGYLRTWTNYKSSRGMSRWHDLVDWVGGFPFEVAKPETVFSFYRERGFELENLRTRGGGLGCNEFVLRRFS